MIELAESLIDDDPAIAGAMVASVLGKRGGPEINTSRFIKPEWLMHSIGG